MVDEVLAYDTWGAQLCTYLRWFARPSLLPPSVSALRLPIGVRHLRIFLRFRMGCHGLPVDVGIPTSTGIPRTQRVCPWCPLQEVGDERQLVFTCPALEHICLRYRHLFTSRTGTMVQFLWQDDLVSVARFIADCFDHFQGAGVVGQDRLRGLTHRLTVHSTLSYRKAIVR